MKNLTTMDVRALTQEPSPQVRGTLAGKIALDYRNGEFTEKEAAIAVDIFRILLKDTETRIRKAIAEQLAFCPHAPRDVILKLASDEADISVPVLEHSSVLTEDDLIQIVHGTYEVLKLCAIARRESISEDLSGSLLETSNTLVLHNLLANRGAALNERQLMKAWARLSSSQGLLEALVRRGGLPLTIAEKLFLAVSDEMKDILKTQYKLAAADAGKAVDDAHEWELLGISPAGEYENNDDDELVEDLVHELAHSGRLTHSLLIRALCVGNLRVFEAGIAKLARVPRVNARILLLESSGLGLKGIYRAAGMPDGFFEAVRVLLRISIEETEFGRNRRGNFRKRVIDRIYLEKYNRSVENMEYILAIIGGKAPATAHA